MKSSVRGSPRGEPPAATRWMWSIISATGVERGGRGVAGKFSVVSAVSVASVVCSAVKGPRMAATVWSVAAGGGEEVTVTGASYPAFFKDVSVGVEDVRAAQFTASGGVGGHVEDFLREEGV